MREEFNNRAALFLWGFAVVWLGMLIGMTWVAVRDGLPDAEDMRWMPLVLAVFWAAGFGLAVHVLGQPCIRVVVHAGRYVRVTWRYPHKTVQRDFPKLVVAAATVAETRDSDGDPYFIASVHATGSPPIRLAEAHQRATCQAACDRFNASLFGPPR